MSKKIIKAATAPKSAVKASAKAAPKKAIKAKGKVAAKKAEAPKKAAAKTAAPKKERKERVTGQYNGKVLVAGKKLEETRLRPDSTRYNALAAIIKAGKKGMKFDDYKAKFPVSNLRWLTAKQEVIVA